MNEELEYTTLEDLEHDYIIRISNEEIQTLTCEDF